MSKQQLIDSIREHNPSAGHEFLIRFDEVALNLYLNHLDHIRQPRGAASMWVRGSETAAVVTRQR